MDMSEGEFLRLYPELHHYTTFKGLEGIITSNSLWATRFDGLNDRSEILHFCECLIPHVAKALAPAVLKQHKNDNVGKSRRKETVEALHIATYHAKLFMDSFFQTSFIGNPDSIPYAHPFITSFCSHSDDSPYEKENGLLSQWRGYSSSEPCAIIFDTKKILALLKKETHEFDYSLVQMREVTYNKHDLKFAEIYSPIINGLSEALSKLIINPNTEYAELNTTMMKLLSATTRFKHRGFMEEREVRIVACPITKEVKEKLIAECDTYPNSHLKIKAKEIRQNQKNNQAIEYISIFKSLDKKIPIKKIIVGPCLQQELVMEKIQKILGNKVKIKRSETPYIPQLGLSAVSAHTF